MKTANDSSDPIPASAPRRSARWIQLLVHVVLIPGLAWTGCSKTEGPMDGPVDVRADGYNILLVTMDTTRADFLGCYGAANASTPNLDRLAKEGVRLTRCSACVSLTLPSHASMLTGYYPFVHGLRNNGTRRLADSFDTLPEILKGTGYATGAEIASAVLDARYGLDQGFDTYNDVPTDGKGGVYPQRRGDDICNAAIEQLQTLAAGKFFLWVHFYDPHDPYDAPGYVGPPGRPAYAAEVAFMDTQIGRLIDELKRLGVEKKTLVALVSDHGEGLGDHGEGGHGYFVYESTVHVPFILWCPGTIPAGRTIDAVTRTVDVYPTLLELVGLTGPDNLHGMSLVSLLKGEESMLAGAAYAESLAGYLRFGLSPLRCLRAEDRKYVLAPNPALHDLQADPDEIRNVIREQESVADGLHGQLRALIEDTPAPPAPGDAKVSMTDEARRNLVTIGYASGASGEDIEREIDIFEPNGADPRSHIEDIRIDNAAMTAYGEGDYATAEAMLRRVVDKFPTAAMVRVDLANALKATNRMGEACDQLARVVEIDPKADDLRFMLAEYLIKAERWDEAEAQLVILEKTLKDDPLVLRDRGLVRIGQGRLDEANEFFKKATELDPDGVRPVRGQVLVLFRKERFAEAEAMLRQALQAETPDPRLQTDLGYALEKQGRIEEAIVSYHSAIQADPDSAEPREYLARLLGEQNRWAEALEQQDRLVEQAPHDAGRLCQRAQTLARLGRHADAAADFEKAHRLNPTDQSALRGLALALIHAGKTTEAIKHLQAAAESRSDDPEMLGLLAYATQEAGDPVGAERLYRQALEEAPDRTDIRAWYGGLLMHQKRLDEAKAEFTRVIQIDPNELDTRYSLGQILAQQGQIDAARDHFEHILQKEPDNVRALHAMGVLNARQQNWAEAARYFEQALRINPSHQPSQSDLDRVRRRMQEQPTP